MFKRLAAAWRRNGGDEPSTDNRRGRRSDEVVLFALEPVSPMQFPASGEEQSLCCFSELGGPNYTLYTAFTCLNPNEFGCTVWGFGHLMNGSFSDDMILRFRGTMGSLSFEVRQGEAGSTQIMLTGRRVSAGERVFVVLLINNNNGEIWCNGEKVGSAKMLPPRRVPRNQLILGKPLEPTAGGLFVGEIAEVLAWDRVLSQKEMRAVWAGHARCVQNLSACSENLKTSLSRFQRQPAANTTGGAKSTPAGSSAIGDTIHAEIQSVEIPRAAHGKGSHPATLNHKMRTALSVSEAVGRVCKIIPVVGKVFGLIESISSTVKEADDAAIEAIAFCECLQPLIIVVESMCEKNLEGPVQTLLTLLQGRIEEALAMIEKCMKREKLGIRLVLAAQQKGRLERLMNQIQQAVQAAQFGLQDDNWTRLRALDDAMGEVIAQNYRVEHMLKLLLHQNGISNQLANLERASICSVASVLGSSEETLTGAIGGDAASRLRAAAEASTRAVAIVGNSISADRIRVGSTLFGGKYKVSGALGAGAFGSVFAVFDCMFQTDRVIKLLVCSSNNVETVLNEGRVLSRLKHPNIVPVVTMDQQTTEDSNVMIGIVMPLVAGQSLDAVLHKEATLPEKRVVRVGMDILSALSYIHASSPPLIHCDIKPANIMLSDEHQHYVLIDFGLAHNRTNVVDGSVACSPAYAPPEVLSGVISSPDAQLDLWALATSLFQLASGILPPRHSHPDTLHNMANGQVSKAFSGVLAIALSEDRKQRFVSADAFLQRLKQL